MKLRLYRTERDTISGKIVLSNDEVKHLFGRVPSRNAKMMPNHFRVHMDINDSRKLLVIHHAEVEEDTSRLEAPWLRPYGKVAWFVTPTQAVANQLSMDTYGKDQGTERNAFVELTAHLAEGSGIRAPVKLKSADVPPLQPQLTPQERAYEALRVVNEYVAANPGRVMLNITDNQAQLWTAMGG